MNRRRDNDDDDDHDPVIGYRRPRNRTWYGARHLALNAEQLLQLRQLRSRSHHCQSIRIQITSSMELKYIHLGVEI